MAGDKICNRIPRMLPEGGRVAHFFGYDSCACCTALQKLMPDDARRPARLQGRDAAEDARTTHPCIRRWLGMLAEEPWEYSTMGKMGFNAYPDTTGHFCWWLAVQKHRT